MIVESPATIPRSSGNKSQRAAFIVVVMRPVGSEIARRDASSGAGGFSQESCLAKDRSTMVVAPVQGATAPNPEKLADRLKSPPLGAAGCNRQRHEPWNGFRLRSFRVFSHTLCHGVHGGHRGRCRDGENGALHPKPPNNATAAEQIDAVGAVPRVAGPTNPALGGMTAHTLRGRAGTRKREAASAWMLTDKSCGEVQHTKRRMTCQI